MFSILWLFENPFRLNSTIRIWLRSTFRSHPGYVETLRQHVMRLEQERKRREEKENDEILAVTIEPFPGQKHEIL